MHGRLVADHRLFEGAWDAGPGGGVLDARGAAKCVLKGEVGSSPTIVGGLNPGRRAGPGPQSGRRGDLGVVRPGSEEAASAGEQPAALRTRPEPGASKPAHDRRHPHLDALGTKELRQHEVDRLRVDIGEAEGLEDVLDPWSLCAVD